MELPDLNIIGWTIEKRSFLSPIEKLKSPTVVEDFYFVTPDAIKEESESSPHTSPM